jgi:hypothetical protein
MLDVGAKCKGGDSRLEDPGGRSKAENFRTQQARTNLEDVLDADLG